MEAFVRTSIISSVAIFALCLSVSRAECQGSTTPPSTPVYGGANTRNAPSDGLGLSAYVYEGFDDDVLATQGSGGVPSQPSVSSGQSGFYTGLGVALLYAHPGERADFSSWASSGVAYYPDVKDLTTMYHQAALSFSAPLGSRVTVHGTPFADYSPYYTLRLIPIQVTTQRDPALSLSQGMAEPTPDVNYTALQQDTFRYGANVGLNISVTGRSSLGVTYGHVRTDSKVELFDANVRSAGASFGYKVSRNASLNAGYFRHESRYARLNSPPTVTENVNIGVSYLKPLSITRRTYLDFGTGTGIAEDLDGNRSLHATGFASLVHQIGRTWTARATYDRGFGYLEGFNEPVSSDSAGAGIGGLISRRVEFSTDAQYLRGTVGLSSSAPPFDSYSAWVRVRTALSRGLAAYAEYLFLSL